MIETIHKKFEGYIKAQVEKTQLAHKVQAMGAHPQEKCLVIGEPRNLKNWSISVSGMANVRAIFGLNCNKFRRGIIR